MNKKQKLSPTLDKYEKNIEDNLEISKALPAQKKVREIAKLKLAAKEHLKKKSKEKRGITGESFKLCK